MPDLTQQFAGGQIVQSDIVEGLCTIVEKQQKYINHG